MNEVFNVDALDDTAESHRAAGPDDVDLLVRIAVDHAARISGERGADLLLRRELSYTEDELRTRLVAAIDEPDSLLLVGTYAGVVFGYALAVFEQLDDGGTLARVEQLVVEPDAREVGIGETIMNAVVDEARTRNCFGVDALALPGDRETKNFFESFGLKARQLVVHRSLSDS